MPELCNRAQLNKKQTVDNIVQHDISAIMTASVAVLYLKITFLSSNGKLTFLGESWAHSRAPYFKLQ